MVRVDCIKAGILQRVGPHLVEKADVAPFLCQIDQNAASGFGHHFQRAFQLLAAIAFQASQHIAGDALRMQSHQRRLRAVNIADNDGKMFVTAELGAKHGDLGIGRNPERHPGAGGDAKALRRSCHVTVDVADFDQHDIVFVTDALELSRVPGRQARQQDGRQQLRDPEKPGRIVGKRAPPFTDEVCRGADQTRCRRIDGEMADPGMVEIMCRQAGAAEFGRKGAAERLEAAAGQNKKRAGPGNPLQMVTMPVSGKLRGLKNAGGAICKAQHDHPAAAQFLTCAISIEVSSIHVSK